jgi:hypothetical protein
MARCQLSASTRTASGLVLPGDVTSTSQCMRRFAFPRVGHDAGARLNSYQGGIDPVNATHACFRGFTKEKKA